MQSDFSNEPPIYKVVFGSVGLNIVIKYVFWPLRNYCSYGTLKIMTFCPPPPPPFSEPRRQWQSTSKSHKLWSLAWCSYYVVHTIVLIYMICNMTKLVHVSAWIDLYRCVCISPGECIRQISLDAYYYTSISTTELDIQCHSVHEENHDRWIQVW